ncbi:MAG: transcriptional regulator NrdR [Lachnospiraceae bacterium]|nr:transcriptional regulator NrdR [Lachnospiraceae bacterium]
MKCPYCGEVNLKVIDSRPVEDNNSIRRRRQCVACEKRFTTYEKVDTEAVTVIKKDKTRQLFDRSKIEHGIIQSCHKLPVSMSQIERAVDEIESKVYALGMREVPSSTIGEIVMDKMREIDEVAYVRFACIYREFRDVNDFITELERMLKK